MAGSEIEHSTSIDHQVGPHFACCMLSLHSTRTPTPDVIMCTSHANLCISGKYDSRLALLSPQADITLQYGPLPLPRGIPQGLPLPDHPGEEVVPCLQPPLVLVSGRVPNAQNCSTTTIVGPGPESARFGQLYIRLHMTVCSPHIM